MPPKKVAAAEGSSDGPIGLTEGELRFIKAVFDNMTQKPDANWDSVAVDLKLKDAKCAKERFRQMSVRHGWRDQTSTASPSPRKKNGVLDQTGTKVTKKKATTPKKKAPKKEEFSDADDGKSEGEDDSTVKTEDPDALETED